MFMTINAKNILVPITGDKAGENAFRLAWKLSKENKSRLFALYVIEVKQELPLDAEVDSHQGEGILSRIEEVGRELKCHVEAEYLQARRAGPAIVQEAQQREAGLIVLGIPYKQRLGQFALGTTTSYVLKHAPCPVVLWREQVGVAAAIGG